MRDFRRVGSTIDRGRRETSYV